MKPMIHVLKVTANAQDAEGADAETRHSLIVFVKCEDEGSAYAPADAHLRHAGPSRRKLRRSSTSRSKTPTKRPKLVASLRCF
jgi:hypothetical protein